MTILEQPPPNQGINYAEMKRRERVEQAFERQKDGYFDLEDADYAVFKAAMEAFQFAGNKRELRQILDDIANARAPEETTVLKVVEDGSAA